MRASIKRQQEVCFISLAVVFAVAELFWVAASVTKKITTVSCDVTLKCKLSLEAAGEMLHLVLEVTTAPPAPTDRQVFPIPSALFENQDERDRWFALTADMFTRLLPGRAAIESYTVLTTANNIALKQLGVVSVNWERYIKEAAKFRTRILRRTLSNIIDRKPRGRSSPWSQAELQAAVISILRHLPRKCRTLALVRAKLAELYPDRAPATGEALGVLLKRFNLSWRRLKTDSER